MTDCSHEQVLKFGMLTCLPKANSVQCVRGRPSFYFEHLLSIMADKYNPFCNKETRGSTRISKFPFKTCRLFIKWHKLFKAAKAPPSNISADLLAPCPTVCVLASRSPGVAASLCFCSHTGLIVLVNNRSTGPAMSSEEGAFRGGAAGGQRESGLSS